MLENKDDHITNGVRENPIKKLLSWSKIYELFIFLKIPLITELVLSWLVCRFSSPTQLLTMDNKFALQALLPAITIK